MANETLYRINIPWGEETVGVFFFDKKDEVETFGKDVISFIDAVKTKNEDAKNAVSTKYKKVKPYRMFFRALEMKINGAVNSEEESVK